MADFWGDVRGDVLQRLHQYAPTMPFEMKIIIAEDAAREVESMGTAFPDGSWPLAPQTAHGRVGCNICGEPIPDAEPHVCEPHDSQSGA